MHKLKLDIKTIVLVTIVRQ